MRQYATFALLALVLTISAGIGSIVVVHLLIFLQARGATFAEAVALGTLFGPAQVGARVIERIFGERYHPIWTMVASCALMAGGLALLLADFPILAVAVVIYAGGYGIMWIARGTLPLALFGPGRYATLMGRLALPSLIVQALAPSAAALVIEYSGAIATDRDADRICASSNAALVAILWVACQRRRDEDRCQFEVGTPAFLITFAPLGDLALDALGELLGRAADRIGAFARHPRAHLRRVDHARRARR